MVCKALPDPKYCILAETRTDMDGAGTRPEAHGDFPRAAKDSARLDDVLKNRG